MKQYLLTSDQIERMLACAIDLGVDAGMDEPLNKVSTKRRFKHPEKLAHKSAIVLFKELRQIEIILPIETN